VTLPRTPPIPARTPARGLDAGRALALVAAVVYVGAVLLLTLRPAPWALDGNEAPFGILNPAAWTEAAAWTEGRPWEILANIVMFVPAGVLAGILLRGVWRPLAPIAFTLFIELGQIPIEGRISHPRDLVANTVGALIGLALYALARRRRRTDAP
jgi:glycopeptide antibiotics resistance protein